MLTLSDMCTDKGLLQYTVDLLAWESFVLRTDDVYNLTSSGIHSVVSRSIICTEMSPHVMIQNSVTVRPHFNRRRQ